MSRLRIATLFLLAAGMLVAAAVAPRLRPPTFHGTDLGVESPALDFTLTAADQGSVSLSDFRDRVPVIFFGYTSCPDVCPTTMARLARAMELLGSDREDVQVLLVTVDPEVDTPDRLQTYVRAFDPAFLGLHGDETVLRQVARDFGAFGGEPHMDDDGMTRLIAHSSHIFGVDRAGRLRLLWGGDLTAEDLAEDLRSLLRL